MIQFLFLWNDLIENKNKLFLNCVFGNTFDFTLKILGLERTVQWEEEPDGVVLLKHVNQTLSPYASLSTKLAFPLTTGPHSTCYQTLLFLIPLNHITSPAATPTHIPLTFHTFHFYNYELTISINVINFGAHSQIIVAKIVEITWIQRWKN